MRAVIQRANGASVSVDGRQIGGFDGPGLVVLLGVTHDDAESQAQNMARKVAELRIMKDEQSASDLAAPVLLISQFTLYGSTKKGRRPSWVAAAPGPVAQPLVDRVAELLAARGLPVSQGEFGADMQVSLTNDGPVTVIVDT
ncbi:MAG: D-aminoacyl-tRNA deacylase [Micrococcales bacterium]|nr:D-aminoacyl-tRNA deacylase [Micrococcales bacterium]